MGIPSYLVPALRQALQGQGFPALIITDAGELDPGLLVRSLVRTVEFRTTMTPPVVIDMLATGEPNPAVVALKPTLILDGPLGRQVIAPYGEAGDGTLGFGLGALALTALAVWAVRR